MRRPESAALTQITIAPNFDHYRYFREVDSVTKLVCSLGIGLPGDAGTWEIVDLFLTAHKAGMLIRGRFGFVLRGCNRRIGRLCWLPAQIYLAAFRGYKGDVIVLNARTELADFVHNS
jgi:hypothetical protein